MWFREEEEFGGRVLWPAEVRLGGEDVLVFGENDFEATEEDYRSVESELWIRVPVNGLNR